MEQENPELDSPSHSLGAIPGRERVLRKTHGTLSVLRLSIQTLPMLCRQGCSSQVRSGRSGSCSRWSCCGRMGGSVVGGSLSCSWPHCASFCTGLGRELQQCLSGNQVSREERLE
eukprot:284816153_5